MAPEIRSCSSNASVDSGYSVHVYRSPTIVDGALDGGTEENSALHVLVFTEGTSVRGALFPVIRASLLEEDISLGVYRKAAAALLQHLHAPAWWALSLAGFLQPRAIPVALEQRHFNEFVEEQRDRIRGQVEHAAYEAEIFDFCSGRILAMRDLQPRRDAYAGVIANCSDLSLDTRFTIPVRASASPGESEMRAVIRWLSWVEENDLRVVEFFHVPTEGLYLELESTIRQWFSLIDHLGWDPLKAARMSEDLTFALSLRDYPLAVMSRVRELRMAFDAERVRQTRTAEAPK